MRRTNAIELLTAVLLPLALLAGDSFALETGDFEKYAESISGSFDKDWQQIVTRTVPSRETAVPALSSGFGGSSNHIVSQRMSDGFSRGWQGIDSAGFLRGGSSGFLPMTSRDRSSPVRGTGALLHPASARFGGSRRLPFNSIGKYRSSLGSGRHGIERKHPDFGTRITSSSRRSIGSSFIGLGATRARRTR